MHDTVSTVMTTNLVCCSPTATAGEAAKQMADHDIGDVLVVDDDRLVGIVTDRDLVVRALATGLDASVPVAEIMSTDLCTVDAGCAPNDAARLMAERAVRRVPVVEGSKPIGIISLGDLAEERARDTVLGEISEAPPNN